MLYYSEILNKTFKTEDELKEQEEKHLAKIKDDEKSKKALVKEIETKDEEIRKAREAVKQAKEDGEKILCEAYMERKELLEKASADLEKVQKERAELIANFADKYGMYQKVYTGKKAEEEFRSLCDCYNSLFSDLWRHLI